jgi:CMP-N,N'-diacetyllegionaminic acid synthase
LLQPTSPLRTTSHIIEACKLLVRNQLIADSLVSVSNVGGNHPARMKVIDEHGLLKNFSGEEDEDMRPRQLLPSVYIRNGAIYINRIEDIVEKKRLVASKCLPFVMTNRESINIDSIEDVLLASKILQNGL